MSESRMRIAELDEDRLPKVHELENQLGTWVVALEEGFRLADLTEEQLAQLWGVEQELGVVLLAYRRP